MVHTESPVKVYYSEQYSRFHMLLGNRELDERKINKIMHDINRGIDILKLVPILVHENEKTSKLDISEGQHRFWISKKLKRPVYYILGDKKMSLLDIAKINSNTEKWKAKDFINCFVQQGNENYKILQQFMDDNHVSLSVAIRLLKGDTSRDKGLGDRDSVIFQKGDFQVGDIEKANTVMVMAGRFKHFPFRSSRPFVTAVSKIMEEGRCDMDEMIEKYERNPAKLTRQPTDKEYIVLLEVIYNLGNHARKTIYS